MVVDTGSRTETIDDRLRPLLDELARRDGCSIVALVPELVAAVRARKNKREAEALLLFILSSPKAIEHVWLTRPVYNPESGALPEPSNHIKKQWLDAAGQPPGPQRRCLDDAIDTAARLTGGFRAVSAAVVDKLAASAPAYEDNATARKARRQRARLDIPRPPGHPEGTGHK